MQGFQRDLPGRRPPHRPHLYVCQLLRPPLRHEVCSMQRRHHSGQGKLHRSLSVRLPFPVLQCVSIGDHQKKEKYIRAVFLSTLVISQQVFAGDVSFRGGGHTRQDFFSYETPAQEELLN